MSDGTKIEWTDATWNPIRARHIGFGNGERGDKPLIGWHCEHVSEGCRNCYAEGFNRRLGTGLDYKPGHRKDVEIYLDEKMLLAPLRWKKPRRIFVCSMTDLFGAFVSDEMIDRMFAVMALRPQHTFQILTKRPERMRHYLSRPAVEVRIGLSALGLCCDAIALNARSQIGGGIKIKGSDINPGALEQWPLANVHLGTSIEDRAALLDRAGDLRLTPAAKRFFSCEPLLGDLGSIVLSDIDWVIAGGESGPNARPMHPAWARNLRDQCTEAGTPFLFKQWGEWAPHPIGDRCVAVDGRNLPNLVPGGANGAGTVRIGKLGKKRAGRLLDGVEHNGYPS